ncbi:orotate phosphoribosyltransferase [Candidatus Bathyarchaeota archaeon]|nr:MAG: orotate phosphoribosyltransferase [Candidatus Bathyarchaeota archaeon]
MYIIPLDVDFLVWQIEKEKYKAEMCEILIRISALRFGTFTLTSGKLSPYYVDLRVIPSFPGAFERIQKFYHELALKDVNETKFKRIAGIPTAGIPFASVLAFLLHKPFIYIRKDAKSHGRERRVEGILHPGDSILLIDDLITSGKNLLSAAEAIRSEGGIVDDALILIDREEGGREALARAGIHLHYLINITDVARTLFKMEIITKEQMMDILKQVKESK